MAPQSVGDGTPLPPQAARPAPWGYVMTVVWTVVSFFVGAFVAVGYCALIYGIDGLLEIMEKMSDLNVAYDGVFTSQVYLAYSLVQMAILALAARAKRWSVSDYLAFDLPTRRATIQALILLVVTLAIVEAITRLLGHSGTSEFQIISYRTAKAAGALPLLLFVILVLAPVTEEIVFRGFLYRGFVRRHGHEPYAIVVIAILFTASHPQYDWVELFGVFLFSLMLGWVRWASGSTALTILLHMLTNLVATILTVIHVEWLGALPAARSAGLF